MSAIGRHASHFWRCINGVRCHVFNNTRTRSCTGPSDAELRRMSSRALAFSWIIRRCSFSALTSSERVYGSVVLHILHCNFLSLPLSAMHAMQAKCMHCRNSSEIGSLVHRVPLIVHESVHGEGLVAVVSLSGMYVLGILVGLLACCVVCKCDWTVVRGGICAQGIDAFLGG